MEHRESADSWEALRGKEAQLTSMKRLVCAQVANEFASVARVIECVTEKL